MGAGNKSFCKLLNRFAMLLIPLHLRIKPLFWGFE
jgi:hypothetical protein